ncbi:hypothetical protein GDO78_023085 [Eleutherodactylus coqui]|uniref:Uncharacterized protein n=1 Tax=Eleutherodactylus coqui TaxID=57060 RepID=A0A8J6EMY9_ELECQ|nr:hypothetical protein GDO78_023085 [Eleutherodactylus coqui]
MDGVEDSVDGRLRRNCLLLGSAGIVGIRGSCRGERFTDISHIVVQCFCIPISSAGRDGGYLLRVNLILWTTVFCLICTFVDWFCL